MLMGGFFFNIKHGKKGFEQVAKFGFGDHVHEVACVSQQMSIHQVSEATLQPLRYAQLLVCLGVVACQNKGST